MTSPFPGMDPYIEACGLWADFHGALIQEIKVSLATTLPKNYIVRTGVRAYVELSYSDGKGADDALIVDPAADPGPVPMRAFIAEEYRENFIEIYAQQPERYLVTCLEVLSPSNKRRDSEGWKLYLRKRRNLLLGGTNFIEIDLLRGGQRMPMLDPWPDSPYTLLVGHSALAPSCRVWPAHFQRRLPVIPLPLAHPDADLALDLQAMIATIYARDRYEHSLDYSKPLKPALTDEETTWLAEQLRTRQTQS